MTSRKIAIAVAVLFVTGLSAASECDAQSAAACDQPALSLIGECTAVYCASATEALARTNLKLVDDKLIELQTTTAQTQKAWDHFRRACQAIGGNMSSTGPAMDDFRNATFQLGLDKGKLKDEYDALQTDPLERLFDNTSSAMARTYRQPACVQQINRRTIDALNAAQDILAKAEIDCLPGGRTKTER
jgi:hypothetical protein